MTQTRLRSPLSTTLVILPALLALAGVAKAQTDEDEPAPSAEEPPPPVFKVPRAPAPAVTREEKPAPQPAGTFFEELGPETYPGAERGPDGIIGTLTGWTQIEELFPNRVRGLQGGSLWLEPSFHGRQWLNSRTGIGFSGMLWIDSGYETIHRGDVGTSYDPSDPKNNPPPPLGQSLAASPYFQRGRAVLRVTPAYVSDRYRFFVQGQAELVANYCQAAEAAASLCSAAGTFTTDDLWIRVGQRNLWDLKIGRFEGWEVYHLGMGMEPYTLESKGAGMFGTDVNSQPPLEAPTPYALNFLHDRPSDGLATGYGALHLYFTGFLRLELLGKLGSDKYWSGNSNDATHNAAYNYFGGRPTLIFDIGWVKLKVGAEYQKRTEVNRIPKTSSDPAVKPTTQDSIEELVQKGVGGSLQVVIDPYVELGASAAIGRQEYLDSTANGLDPTSWTQSFTRKTAGGFLNVRLFDGLMLGGGLHWTTNLDRYGKSNVKASGPTGEANDNNYTTQLQGFGALQYMLTGRILIKAVFAYSKAEFQSGQRTKPEFTWIPVWHNTMYSGRLRLMYLF
jgi:hypothetical protein